jgi:hypothetical protein
MARQLGHVKYKGTIGDIRHFKIKGMTGNFAGMNGGATGEQIKSGASFVRTRENMNEFAGCASVGKAIRAGQSQLMKTMSDPQLTGRLTGIVKKINLEDQTEARGYRSILISAVPQPNFPIITPNSLLNKLICCLADEFGYYKFFFF